MNFSQNIVIFNYGSTILVFLERDLRKQVQSCDALLLTGVAGSGKGFISKIARRHWYNPISSGDLMRGDKSCPPEILATGSLDEGERAFRLVKAEFYRIGVGKRFTFDGYPRTTEQCMEMFELLTQHGYRFAAINVETDLEIAKARVRKDPKRKGRTDNGAIDERHIQDLIHIAEMTDFWHRLGVTVYVINNNQPQQYVIEQLDGIVACEEGKRSKGTFSFYRRPALLAHSPQVLVHA